MNGAVVTAYPRIHITLVDLAHGTGRRYGGAGFALDAFKTTAIAKRARSLHVVPPEHFDSGDAAEICEAVGRVSGRLGVIFDVAVRCDAPSHSGFGTKTMTILAALRACAALADEHIETRELVRLSRRGGTSGIGVHTAFVGGFVVDAGHPADSMSPLLPSSSSEGLFHPPTATVKLSVPEQWRVHLFLPNGRRVVGQVERQFFQHNTPIPRWEVLEVLAALYHGVVPALAVGNLAALASALKKIHEVGFKRREVEYQGIATLTLLRFLNGLGSVAAGMSSFGPLVYAIAGHESPDLIALFGSRYASTYLGQFRAKNQGSSVLLCEEERL